MAANTRPSLTLVPNAEYHVHIMCVWADFHIGRLPMNHQAAALQLGNFCRFFFATKADDVSWEGGDVMKKMESLDLMCSLVFRLLLGYCIIWMMNDGHRNKLQFTECSFCMCDRRRSGKRLSHTEQQHFGISLSYRMRAVLSLVVDSRIQWKATKLPQTASHIVSYFSHHMTI